jgi:uncharacterized HAD superfamily protein
MKKLKNFFKDFDPVDLEYFLRDIEVNDEFEDLLIENYKIHLDFEKSLNITKGIIILEEYVSPYEDMLQKAKVYKLENDVLKAFDKYIEQGYSEKQASQMAIWDWDI